ncbi:MAG: DUF4332 domain-containing protein [Ktedonobacterales bacterium]
MRASSDYAADLSAAAIRDLRRIPGVGPRIARDLLDLGVRSVAELDGADPDALYQRIRALRGVHQDRCLLYVFRCAVYFAGPGPHEPGRLRWWAWKDAPAATASEA